MLDPQVLLEAVRDSRGRVVDFAYRSVNRAACSYLGLEVTDLIDHSALETLPNLEGSGLLGRYARCLEDGQPAIFTDFSYFNEIIDDGRRYDIRATKATTDLLCLTWSDVTERFQTAQRLAESEAKYHRAIDHAAVAVCLTTPDGRLHEVNDAACRLFGYDAETLKQKTWQELTPPEYMEASLQNVKDLREGRTDFFRVTKQYIHADGHLIWVDLSVSCIRDADGRVVNDVALITDITGQVEANERNRVLAQQLQRQNEQLAASERTYRLLVENTAGVVCHIREGRIVWMSPTVDPQMGAPASHWLGRAVLDSVPAENVPAIIAMLATCEEGGTIRDRVPVIGADGAPHWLELNAKPFYDDNGHQDGVSAAFHLIDDEVAAERALEEARRQQVKTDQRYRRSIDDAAVGMCLVTPEGRLEDVNDAMGRMFGYDASAMNGTHWQDFTAPEYLEEELNNVNAILEGRTDSYRMVKHYLHTDGHQIWGDVSVSGVRDDNGHVEHLIVLITDITARAEADERNRMLAEQLRQQNEQIAASERNYRLLADNAVDVVIHFRHGEVEWVSPSVEAAVGVTAKQFIGSDFNARIHPDERDTLITSLREIAPDGSLLQRFRVRTVDDDYHWVDCHAKPYINAEGNTDGLILALRIIDDQVEAEQRLERLARFDTLTGLASRAEVIGRLESALEPTRKPGPHLGVLFCDVDGFKGINDTFGHAGGDAVLSTLARRMRQCVRDEDTVGRTGGDEILVLLPGIHSIDEASRIAEKIRSRAAEPIHESGQTINVTLSIGAVLANSGETASVVLARADAAMYQAKAHGNAVVSIP